ncbi:hypothetical protein LJC23_05215, partial [Desulfovibrio sp. OttesenSCG-928-I05]|nr:hypothetical protein [Desulfovibrio sp. OttesenSCG-928-I05]
MRSTTSFKAVVYLFTLLALSFAPISQPGTMLSGPVEALAAPADTVPAPKARSYFTRMPQYKGMYQFDFNQAMINPETVAIGTSLPLDELPIYFDPPFAGEGKWVSDRQLTITSYDSLPQATPLKILVRPGSVSADGREYSQRFSAYTPYPFVTRGLSQLRYAKDGTVTLSYNLSCNTDLAKLKAALRIRTKFGKEDIPFEIRQDDGKNAGRGKDFLIDIKPETLERLFVSLPADFTSEEGPQGIGARDTEYTKDGFVTREVDVTSMFLVNTVRAGQTSSPPWERYIRVETTNDADMDLVKKFITITPEMDFTIEPRSGGFTIAGDFITRPRVQIVFKKGMPGLLGYLTEDFKATVQFDDFSPRLSLDTQGVVLSPERAMRVPLSSMNVERIQATLWQVPENNIPLMAMGFFNSWQKHLSRKVAVRQGNIGAVRNRQSDSSLDLTQIAGQAKGVFLLTVSDASDPSKTRSDEPSTPYYYDEYDEHDDYYDYDYDLPVSERLVVISDIGLMARTMSRSITVWANSIATTAPLRDARVRVYAANNILLAEGRTDKDGLWTHSRDEDWDSRLRPAIIVVSTNADNPGVAKGTETAPGAEIKDISFLKLDADLSADDAFDTGGRQYLSQGYEAFCFTPRGVFRPGETVNFKVMVRDAMLNAPKPFPVAWKVTSSTGRTVGQGTSLLSPEGGAAFTLQLVPSSPTGKYSMTVTLPGQGKRVLGSCSFSVEDFQPPRIEVALASDQPFIIGNDSATVSIDAKYLFGTPVANAPWEADLYASPLTFRPDGWRAFSFPVTAPSRTELGNDSGELDERGTGESSFTMQDAGTAAMNLTASVRVREDGGRWVARNITVPWFAKNVMLGFEVPSQEASAGTPHAVRVAAVTPEGKASDAKELKVIAEVVQYYYVRSDRGYTQSSKYTEVASSVVALKDGVGVFNFTPPQRGNYRLRVESADYDASATTWLGVWTGLAGSGDGGSPLVDRVMLSWEEKGYHVGEKARLKIRAPFTGKLLLVLESDREIYRQVYMLDTPEKTVEVPVLASMAPNAYASAWVIRPVEAGETWGAHRAFGIAPLMVSHANSKLTVAIDAPEAVLPKGQLPVTVSLKNARGEAVKGEVTLAFVDEGLLALTSFKTPDPFGFFTAKRALMSFAYDLYDALMPLTSRAAIALEAGGDGGGDGSLLSPLSRKLELLSIFVATLETDENGMVTTTLDLPEYSGKGRLMAIASAGSSVGSTMESVRVAREITVEATTPRMVAPGDRFDVPIFAFASDPAPRKASVEIITEGPLAIDGDSVFPISLDAGTPKASIPLKVIAQDASGMAALRIVTTIEGATQPPFEQRLEIPVRPPFPRQTRTGNGLVRGGEKATIDVGGGFYPGTQQVELSFADSPSVSLFKALGYLRSYPYGCLEQTVSSTWPYLAAPSLLRSIDPEIADNSEYRQALDYAIRRILSMQRGDGGFNTWPGRTRGSAYGWGSAYAAHFLTEAKSTGLVPEDALKAAIGWLRAYLASPLPYDGEWEIRDMLSTKAYIAYVLTLNGDAPLGWMQFLKDQGSFLSDSARIFLAGAYALATGKADALREYGVLPLKGSGPYGWSMESRARNEALRLLMWVGVDPFAGETATLAARVIKDGNDGYWYNTQENGMAVLALGRFTEKTAGPNKEFSATLTPRAADGKTYEPIATFKNGETPVFTRNQLVPAEPAAPAPVELAVTGGGTSYYSWTSSGVPMEAQPAVFEGITMARRWELTSPDGSVSVIDFNDYDGKNGQRTGEAPISIPLGTQVTVTLYLKP